MADNLCNYIHTHDYSVLSPLGQRPVLMFRGKVIPNDGTARILITDIDRKHPLSCHLYIGNQVYKYGWFVHSTTETVQKQFKIKSYRLDDNDFEFRDDSRGWSQRRIDNYLLLQKVYTTPNRRSVYLSSLS